MPVSVAHERPVLAIVSPGKDVYSETFIRAHIERLPANVKLLYGGYLPIFYGDGQLLCVPPNRLERWRQRLFNRIRPLPENYYQELALEKWLLDNRVDAVLAEYGPTGVAVMDVCVRARIPLVVHFHGYDAYERTTLESMGKQYPRLFDRASAIVVSSHALANQLGQLGAPREKIHRNPYGVDPTAFHSGDPAASPPTFVAVGRFVDKKAPHLTLLAFAQVAAIDPNARLVMIGDGPLLEACQQLARALHLNNCVDFRGALPHNQLAAVLRSARAFVQHSMQTSYGDSESLGVVFLEAAATGLPVIATRHDGIPEVVLDSKTGFLVDEGDVTGMAERMIRLARDPGLAARLGSAAQQRVGAEFPIGKSIANLWRIIQTARPPSE